MISKQSSRKIFESRKLFQNFFITINFFEYFEPRKNFKMGTELILTKILDLKVILRTLDFFSAWPQFARQYLSDHSESTPAVSSVALLKFNCETLCKSLGYTERNNQCRLFAEFSTPPVPVNAASNQKLILHFLQRGMRHIRKRDQIGDPGYSFIPVTHILPIRKEEEDLTGQERFNDSKGRIL